MSSSAVCVLALVLGILGSGLIFGGRLPSGFRDRACQGRGWRRAFPNAPKDRIRAFLQVFVGAFAFRDSERLQFSPDDRILDVYRDQRSAGERFIETFRRLGVSPFRERAYAADPETA